MTKDSRGFTIIEMLIALAIGAGIAVLAYRALDGAIRADEKVSAVTQQIDEVDRVWQYLGNDLFYAVPRIWVDRSGEEKSALIGVAGDRLSQSDAILASEDEYLLYFIRSNRDNVLDRPRSNLLMVGYRLTLEEGSDDLKILWRDSWGPVDGSDDPKMQQRRLLGGIKTMNFRYLPAGANATSQPGWPPGSGGVSDKLPAAVEVNVELAGFGEVRRIFSLSVVE